MIRTPEELSLAIKSAVDRRAVVISHITLAVTATVHTILWPGTEPFEQYIMAGLGVALIAMILLRFFDLASINSRPLVYIIIYQILTFIGLAFLAEPATPYVLVAMITAIISNLYYGKKGVYITVAVFGLASVAKYMFRSSLEPLAVEDTLDIFVSFFVFAAVASFMVHIQAVYDWDRSRLKSLMTDATIGRQRLNTLINSMSEAVLVLDESYMIRQYNLAALKLFNKHTSIEMQELFRVVSLKDMDNKPIDQAEFLPKDNKTEKAMDIRLKYNEHDSAIVAVNIAPLQARVQGGDNYNGYIVTMRDVTKEKTLEQEHNEFISVISHELRTPVATTEASLSNAELFNKKQGGKEQVEKNLAAAHQQSLLLAQMLNDLSLFVDAERDDLHPTAEDVHVADTMAALEAEFGEQATAKGLKLKFVSDKKLPATLRTSGRYLTVILRNLINNAIKYSDEGTITVHAGLESDNKRLRLSVSDKGIGMSLSDQQQVCNKFFRSEDFHTRATGGVGLGLYITKRLVELLGGRLEIESELDKGSTFSVIIGPLDEEAATPDSEKK